MLMRPIQDDELPLDYQEEELKRLFRILLAGESCALVGVGSVGKSTLARFLDNDAVKEKYLPKEKPPLFVIVYIDSQNTVELSDLAIQHAGECWSGYEIFLSRLRFAVWNLEMKDPSLVGDRDTDLDDETLLEEVQNRYQCLLSSELINMQIGLRHLEEAVYELLAMGDNWRLIFVIDEIEELFRQMPPRFFFSLRGLRDNFKRRLMYVTISRWLLTEIADKCAKEEKHADYQTAMFLYEGFIELFHETTRYVELLTYESVVASVKRYIDRRKLTLKEQQKHTLFSTLYELTNGHVGLLHRCFEPVVYTLKNDKRSTMLDVVLGDWAVQNECRTILRSVPPVQQETLIRMAQGKTESNESQVVESLVRKKLVTLGDDNKPVISIEIFREFLRQESPSTR